MIIFAIEGKILLLEFIFSQHRMRLSANTFFSSHFPFQKEMLLAFHSKGELDKVDAALLNRLFPCDCSVFNFSSRSGVLDYRRYPKILVSNQCFNATVLVDGTTKIFNDSERRLPGGTCMYGSIIYVGTCPWSGVIISVVLICCKLIGSRSSHFSETHAYKIIGNFWHYISMNIS